MGPVTSVTLTFRDGTTQVLPDPNSITITRNTTLAELIDLVKQAKDAPQSKEPPLAPLVPAPDERWKKQEEFNQSQAQFNREFLEALKDIKTRLPVKP